MGIVLGFKGIHANEHVLYRVKASLLDGSGFFDAELGQPCLNGLGHSPELFYFFQEFLHAFHEFCAALLYGDAAAKGIHKAGDSAAFLNANLRFAGDSRRKIRRQGNSLVERISMKGLGSAQCCCHGFNGSARHVVVGLLLGQAPARGLAVRPEDSALGIFGIKRSHDSVPERPSRAELGHFGHKVHPNGPEEAESRSEFVDVKARRKSGAQILQPVCQRIGEFQFGRGAGLVHVVSRDRNAIEFRHSLARESEDVGNDAQAWCRRVDVGIPHHKFLENVVLNGALQGIKAMTLLLRGNNVEGQNGQHGTVHGHRNRHFIQRNSLKEALHVFYAVDGYARLAYVALYPRMVAVVAAVGRQVKGYAQPLLPGREVAAVEGVALFGGAESSVLPYGPGPLAVHGRMGSAQEGRLPRERKFVG